MEITVLVSLIVRIERILMELSAPVVERPGLVWKASKTSELLREKAFQDQDFVAPIPEGFFEFPRMKETLR